MSDLISTNEYRQDELEEYRVELRGYCYRMLGSSFEADDAVQDTMVRAWRNINQFEGRSALRSWLYRIATNVCLTMLDSRGRRAMPMDLGPSSQATTFVGPKKPELPWVEPMPSARALPASNDPAEVAVMRDSIRLAFIVALQCLPPRQRAVLVLCEVLRWKAEEVAEFLESSVASVNSALQRARATLEARDPESASVTRPMGANDQKTIDRYAASFERYDMDELASLLHADVVMSMPPYELWLQGADQVRAWLLGHGIGCQGSRLIPVEVNGMLGFGQYRPDPNGGWEPWALQAIEVTDGAVTGITSFLDTPHLFPLFDLPSRIDA